MITCSPENAAIGKIQDALTRAAKTAREEARRHGVPIVVWTVGQVVLEDPEMEPVEILDQQQSPGDPMANMGQSGPHTVDTITNDVIRFDNMSSGNNE